MPQKPSDGETEQPNGAEPEGWDPRTRVEIVLELHEVIGLSLLYEAAPIEIELEHDGAYYGPSADTAALKLATALARLSGDKELLLKAGALRARLDQLTG